MRVSILRLFAVSLLALMIAPTATVAQVIPKQAPEIRAVEAVTKPNLPLGAGHATLSGNNQTIEGRIHWQAMTSFDPKNRDPIIRGDAYFAEAQIRISIILKREPNPKSPITRVMEIFFEGPKDDSPIGMDQIGPILFANSAKLDRKVPIKITSAKIRHNEFLIALSDPNYKWEAGATRDLEDQQRGAQTTDTLLKQAVSFRLPFETGSGWWAFNFDKGEAGTAIFAKVIDSWPPVEQIVKPSYEPPLPPSSVQVTEAAPPKKLLETPVSRAHLPDKFRTFDDVPVCNDLAVSKNLFELAIKRHDKAYVTMFKQQMADSVCVEIPKDTIVYVTRLTDIGNMVEMKLENGAVAYGPAMMLEPAPLQSNAVFAARLQTCWRPTLREPGVIARVTYGRDGKIQKKMLYSVPISQGDLNAIEVFMVALKALDECAPMPMPSNQTGPLTVEYKFSADGVK